MTQLIALLSSGKGTWNEVAQLIKSQQWGQVFLITDAFGSKFSASDKIELLVVDFGQSTAALSEDIRKKLSEKVNGLEVAVNLSSGAGKEHMALLSALMKLGLGFRIVTVTDRGYKEL